MGQEFDEFGHVIGGELLTQGEADIMALSHTKYHNLYCINVDEKYKWRIKRSEKRDGYYYIEVEGAPQCARLISQFYIRQYYIHYIGEIKMNFEVFSKGQWCPDYCQENSWITKSTDLKKRKEMGQILCLINPSWLSRYLRGEKDV